MQTATRCARRSGAARRCASTASISSDGTSGTADLRTQLLRAALQHIPEHGFSIRALQAAATSVPALQRLSASPLALDQLFPSLPPRSLPSNPLRQRWQSAKPLDDDATAELSTAERVGPARALFDEWAREGRSRLQATLGSDPKAKSSVLNALRRRLEYNLPVLPFLPEALSTLSIPDPSKSSLPNPKAYVSHVQAIARDIKDFTRAEASLTQLATAYALAEAYQASRARPSFDQVLEHAASLLKRTGRYDSAFRDTWQFGGYVVSSWKNIIKSRGL